MSRLPQHVRKIDTPAGTRYEARVNSGGRSARIQLRKRFRSASAAADWRRRTSAALADGAYTAKQSLTVKQAVEAWLAAKALRVKPTTHSAYSAALAPVVKRYGKRTVQSITKADVEGLVADLAAGKGKRKPWARTSINPMLARWRTVWAGLHAEGVVPRNVIALVEPLRRPAGQAAMKVDDSLTLEEVDTLTAAHVGHFREAFLLLALLGLRRGEIAGLRWSAVDLDPDTPKLEVRATRVATADGTIEQSSAKTATSARTLPLPARVAAVLKRTRAEQEAMRRKAGNLWQGARNGHVVALELGAPPSPRTLDVWWHASLKHAGLSPRRLHAARHTAASLLNSRGAAVPTIAAWLGHSDGGTLAMRVYVKARNDALADAAALFD